MQCYSEEESGLLLWDIFFIPNLSWPDLCSSAKGIWLLFFWAQCDQSGMWRTSQMKLQDFFQSLPSLLSGNRWCTTYWRRIRGYNVFNLLDSSTIVFFPSHLLWMDIWTQIEIFQHKKHPNVDLYKAMFVFIFLNKMDTAAHQSTWDPCPKIEDYIF